MKSLKQSLFKAFFLPHYINTMSLARMRCSSCLLHILKHHRDVRSLGGHLALKQIHTKRPLKLCYLLSHYGGYIHGNPTSSPLFYSSYQISPDEIEWFRKQ